MDPQHARLAQIGLTALEKYGFVLAGGYTVQAHGFLPRPSEDVDLFTNQANADAFLSAVDEAATGGLSPTVI